MRFLEYILYEDKEIKGSLSAFFSVSFFFIKFSVCARVCMCVSACVCVSTEHM